MSALRREEILGLPLPITSPDEIADPTSYLAMAQARHHAQVHLRRPFEPAAVRWKVQSVGDGYGIVVAYIDARLVVERLNAVVGGEWSDEYRVHAQGVEECALTVS